MLAALIGMFPLGMLACWRIPMVVHLILLGFALVILLGSPLAALIGLCNYVTGIGFHNMLVALGKIIDGDGDEIGSS